MLDGVWDVVEFEVEENAGAGRLDALDEGGAVFGEKLEADFVETHGVTEIVDEFECCVIGGDVEGDDDFLAGIGHNA